MTTAAGASGDRQASWDDLGFYRMDRFAAPEVGQAMLDDVIGLVRAAQGGFIADGALVLPEANLAERAGAPEELTSKVFRLHRRPEFRTFLERSDVAEILIDRLGPDVDCFLSQFI